MGLFAKGSVVLVSYPFSDLSNAKLRPAVVLAGVSSDDFILCQITTRPYASKRVIELTPQTDPNSGLNFTSYVRPEKLFTGNATIVREQIGILQSSTIEKIISSVIELLRKAD
jgi:mRNA interferase MazF